jgi:ribosomal protein L35AE/L33A
MTFYGMAETENRLTFRRMGRRASPPRMCLIIQQIMKNPKVQAYISRIVC